MEKIPLLEKVEQTIIANALMRKGSLYLVALSGGADSVALLLSLKRLGYTVEGVHCNFHLRGKESDRDECFCIDLCSSEDIKLHIVHFDTRSYANLHKQSIEMAARTLRYEYFKQLATDIGAAGICVGHHLEDSVETLLINLIRGTGINGLTGIGLRNGLILRPLLEVTRVEIEAFLEAEGQSFVIDSTNLVDDVTRNRIRLNIMPLIKEINPSAVFDIAKTARRLDEANKVFQVSIGNACKDVLSETKYGYSIDVKKLIQQVSPQYTIFSILTRFSFSSSTIDDIFRELPKMRNGCLFMSKSHCVLFDRGKLLIEAKDNFNTRTMKFPETGIYMFDERQKFILTNIERTANFEICRDKDTATLDADTVIFPLVVRHCIDGDRFVPFGMKGKKLLSDYMTDLKFSLFDKQRQLAVVDASGNIIWLVGERPDNRFTITSETKHILTIKATTTC